MTFIETVPGDFIEFKVSDLVRAIPMVTSPFLRAKQHLEAWFVPYEQLWSGFEEFITQRSQPRSSSVHSTAFAPRVSRNVLYRVSHTSTASDVHGFSYSAGAQRLLNYCGYGTLQGSPADLTDVNLWRLAAYNKIWYDEYRQKYYDTGLRFLNADSFVRGSDGVNPAVIFNFDDILCESATSASIRDNSTVIDDTAQDDRILEMCQMRYRCWKKDLFTGVLPSTQYGAVSSVSGFWPDTSSKSIRTSNGSLNNTSRNTISVNGSRQVSVESNGSSADLMVHGVPGISILDLRKSTAIQLWREAALTAGNRVSDNLRAHYGDDAEYSDARPSFLGAVSAPLSISDINATAEVGSGENQSLGDVAGKGLSTFDDKVFKFKSHKFGVIVCMYSILPEAEYCATGIDRMNQLVESEDYFIPEYQDLGLEPVSNQDFLALPASQTSVLGYAPRYVGYKQKLDKCFTDFYAGENFAPWASPKTDIVKAFSTGPAVMPLSLLYVNPSLYDGNFKVSVSNSRQFMIDIFFNVDAVRPMSVSGLPID